MQSPHRGREVSRRGPYFGARARVIQPAAAERPRPPSAPARTCGEEKRQRRLPGRAPGGLDARCGTAGSSARRASRGLGLERDALARPERAHAAIAWVRPRLPSRSARRSGGHLVPAREEAARLALGPVLPRRHRRVRPSDVDRHDRDPVRAPQKDRRAGAQLADGRRARERVPSGNISRLQPWSISRSTWSVAPACRRPTGERDRVEHQRDPVAFRRDL